MWLVVFIALLIGGGVAYDAAGQPPAQKSANPTPPAITQPQNSGAMAALGKLAVKGRAPRTGYEREQFASGWAVVGDCDVRNHILKRDMTDVQTVSTTDCTVLRGSLDDPYTAKTIQFTRGAGTSDDVQIDHVVALSNAWQTGAQQLTAARRLAFYNDPLNLLAVDGPANQKKSASDAATWLPSNKTYRCRYVARQIAVKTDYTLWVTKAEAEAMSRVLSSCPNQALPIVTR